MSLWSAYRNLSFRSKLGVGVGLLAWGAIGPYLSDRAEARFGFTPTEEEKAALDKMAPKIHVVDKDERP
ncbi:hypothetical protein NKR23_g11688 [Pleurostoma richardsiae]|uniref:Uncharacterized protein n=1 Tax=Pleurostoma richardsiae TaxID=41990 RepID=A0AA38R7C2_9PEZI|nr:hypothetical protein NKR23_g11688 [Pleurostoma richardsiae]